MACRPSRQGRNTLHWITFAAGLALPATGLFASGYPGEMRAATMIQIQRELFNERFAHADSLSRSMIRTNPFDPAGYLFSAAGLFAEMVTREENVNPSRFHALLDTADNLAAAVVDTSRAETAAWMRLFLGHSKVYRSLWESRFGSFAAAIRLGMAAKSEYNTGLKCDSARYDLYFGLGSYHYWKSAKAGFLRWLGFFKNEKGKGIDELYLAIDSAMISRESARNSLIWIWLDQKRYDSAIAACREMFASYPEGKVFLWPLAQAYYRSGDYASAAQTYRLLRERLIKESGNYFNLIECDFQLYRCYDKLALVEDAQAVAAGLAAYYKNIPKETRYRQRTKLGYLRKAMERSDGFYPAQMGVDLD